MERTEYSLEQLEVNREKENVGDLIALLAEKRKVLKDERRKLTGEIETRELLKQGRSLKEEKRKLKELIDALSRKKIDDSILEEARAYLQEKGITVKREKAEIKNKLQERLGLIEEKNALFSSSLRLTYEMGQIDCFLTASVRGSLREENKKKLLKYLEENFDSLKKELEEAREEIKEARQEDGSSFVAALCLCKLDKEINELEQRGEVMEYTELHNRLKEKRDDMSEKREAEKDDILRKTYDNAAKTMERYFKDLYSRTKQGSLKEEEFLSFLKESYLVCRTVFENSLAGEEQEFIDQTHVLSQKQKAVFHYSDLVHALSFLEDKIKIWQRGIKFIQTLNLET